ncbi:MAG: short-chain-enoyl-CoA hydratase, partial [Pseudomonadota bacterium]
MELATDRMIAEKDGAIGWMIFNNPERHNAISYEMRLAILDILAEFERDPAIRVIVLKGAGEKAFVAGSDISQFDKKRATPEQQADYASVSGRVQDAYDALSKPLIAMIQGYCLGAGVGTALNADIRIASEDAQFGIPAGRLGIAYPYAALKRLVDVVGASAA